MAEPFASVWIVILGAGGYALVVVQFFKDFLSVRKLEMEIAELKRQKEQKQPVIVLATPEEVERFGKLDAARERRLRTGGLFGGVSCAALVAVMIGSHPNFDPDEAPWPDKPVVQASSPTPVTQPQSAQPVPATPSATAKPSRPPMVASAPSRRDPGGASPIPRSPVFAAPASQAAAAHPAQAGSDAGLSGEFKTARAACGTRVFLALAWCIDRQCEKPAFYTDPECVRLRELRVNPTSPTSSEPAP